MKLVKTESRKKIPDSRMIDLIAFSITVSLFIAAIAAALYMHEWGHVFRGWHRILISPGPKTTDYYEVGGLAASFLNAGTCGLICVLFMVCLKGDSRPNAMAGYFLVIAHCFYGLNPLNMLPCFLAPILYFKNKNLDVNDNLHVCMFATCFGPFISEFLFRYTLQEEFVQGEVHLTALGIIIAVIFLLILGFVIPAILPGAHAWHKGYNLFNGGLAFGIFGFFVYNLLYTTFGVMPPEKLSFSNPWYDSFHRSYSLFVNAYFIILFSTALLTGYYLNGRSLKGYRRLMTSTGHMNNFVEIYGMPLCLINIGIYGMMFLFYVNLVMGISEGVGFTGPTTGVLFAALTFALLGQHPKNVWPILAGFLAMYVVNLTLSSLTGLDPGWTISSQPYINAAAFATGMCPIVGRYGRRAGYAAGMIDAALCRATANLHGGLVLYNGGFTAGLTVLILLPVLEHYVRQQNYKNPPASMYDFIVVEERKGMKKAEPD